MNNKILKSNNAITLIALIITIIVLLILAMVSIKLIWDGGIIKHAQNATSTYTIEQEKELINLGYSNYQMGKYSQETTEDLETLKEYFVGKDLNNLVDESKSTDEQIVFTNGISITEADYIEIDDTKGAYNFYYNGYNYRLIFNTDTTIGENLEIRNKELTVEGAKVDGNETKGWTITFEDTKHTYELTGTGNVVDVSNQWWKLTEDEEKEIVYVNNAGAWIVSRNTNLVVGFFYDDWENERKDALIITKEGEGAYLFFLTEEYKNSIINNYNKKVEKYKWYYSTDASNFENLEEYTGECPIKMSDFTKEEIVSESYLQRLIENFNN